jgi:hypothetical protein
MKEFGYTEACARCFAPIPFCSFQAGCGGVCSDSPGSPECRECTTPCDEEFDICAGLPDFDITQSPTLSPTLDLDSFGFLPETKILNACERQQEGIDYESIETYYVVYEIKFFDAIKTAWTNNARLLAVIVVLFSGVWPYAKNIVLMFVWFLPMKETRRSSLLLWLRRLGKYTLIDIYVSECEDVLRRNPLYCLTLCFQVVIILIVGVMLEITVADATIIVRGEPRLALIGFLFATLWEFVHIEWMTHCHQKKLNYSQEQECNRRPEGNILDSLRFRRSCASDHNSLACRSPACLQVAMWLLVCVSIGSFLAGSIVENIRFTSVSAENKTEGCVRSYSLYSLGATLISDQSLQWNSVKPLVWILFVTYIILLVVIPLFVHLIHVLVCVLNVKDKLLCRSADICWTFACVDVYVIGLYIVQVSVLVCRRACLSLSLTLILLVQYKFDEIIEALAGNEGSEFFGIYSHMGPGFYILIGYSVFAGFLQYLFNCAVSHYYQVDVHDRVNYIWTKPFGCFLTNGLAAKSHTDREGTESTLQAI